MIKDVVANLASAITRRNPLQLHKSKRLLLLKAQNRVLAEVQERKQVPFNQAMPTHLTIETTMKCNLRCVMCECTHHVKNPMAQPSMDHALFQKMAEELFPTLEKVSLSVSGEPLLSQHIDEEIEAIRRYGVKLEINTNATLLQNDELIRKLLQVLSHMSISFDGAKKETYESIRRGARYEKVLANTRRFTALRNSLPKNRSTLDMTYVLMRRNIEEFSKFVGLAKEVGADSVSAAHLIVHDQSMKDESLVYHKELANKFLVEARERAGELGINVLSMPPFFDISNNAATGTTERGIEDEHSTEVKRIRRCPFLWKRAFVSYGGDVTPCCVPGRPVMGNLANRSFQEIWNGDLYKKMRNRLNSDDPFECCKHCNQLQETVTCADEEAFIRA